MLYSRVERVLEYQLRVPKREMGGGGGGGGGGSVVGCGSLVRSFGAVHAVASVHG